MNVLSRFLIRTYSEHLLRQEWLVKFLCPIHFCKLVFLDVPERLRLVMLCVIIYLNVPYQIVSPYDIADSNFDTSPRTIDFTPKIDVFEEISTFGRASTSCI